MHHFVHHRKSFGRKKMHLRTNKFTSFRIKVRHGQEQKMVLSCISVLKFVKDSRFKSRIYNKYSSFMKLSLSYSLHRITNSQIQIFPNILTHQVESCLFICCHIFVKAIGMVKTLMKIWDPDWKLVKLCVELNLSQFLWVK